MVGQVALFLVLIFCVFILIQYLVFGEEFRLKIFKSKLLSSVSKPKRGEFIGEERKLLNEDVYNLYCTACSTTRLTQAVTLVALF